MSDSMHGNHRYVKPFDSVEYVQLGTARATGDNFGWLLIAAGLDASDIADCFDEVRDATLATWKEGQAGAR